MTYVWLSWLADALRDEGCKVVEESGWKNRGRPNSTGAFNPYGVAMHHTGTKSSSSNPHPTLGMCINGRSDLPGPLCQVLIGYDGKCHVIAAGRANHAGECNGFGPFSSGDGNAQLVGFEIDYDGTQAMSAAQKDAATRAGAAVLRRMKKAANYAATHKETSTTGKWDTGGVTGDQWRNMIGDRLGGSAGSGGSEGLDNVGLQDPISEWSPDEGSSKDDTTVGKTLNQARGYSEDTYDRMKALQSKVANMEKTLNKILDAVT